MKNKQNHKKGFTLIELLVVVAIMGMLAALAVVALNNARQRARDARRVSDIKQIQTALELYFLDNNGYPAGTPAGGDDYISSDCLSSTNGFAAGCAGTVYMSVVPDNPDPYDDNALCVVAYTDYLYKAMDKNVDNYLSYTLKYCVGNAIGQIDAGDHIATPAGISD